MEIFLYVLENVLFVVYILRHLIKILYSDFYLFFIVRFFN